MLRSKHAASYTFECFDSDEVANDEQKCTLTAENGFIFHGSLSKNHRVVIFKPIRFGEAPVGSLRWKAPVLVTDYQDPVQGHFNEKKCKVSLIQVKQVVVDKKTVFFSKFKYKNRFLRIEKRFLSYFTSTAAVLIARSFSRNDEGSA